MGQLFLIVSTVLFSLHVHTYEQLTFIWLTRIILYNFSITTWIQEDPIWNCSSCSKKTNRTWWLSDRRTSEYHDSIIFKQLNIYNNIRSKSRNNLLIFGLFLPEHSVYTYTYLYCILKDPSTMCTHCDDGMGETIQAAFQETHHRYQPFLQMFRKQATSLLSDAMQAERSKCPILGWLMTQSDFNINDRRLVSCPKGRNEVFLSEQPCQYGVSIQCSGDSLHLHKMNVSSAHFIYISMLLITGPSIWS